MSLDILKWIRGWRLDKFFHNFKENAAKVAVSITETVHTISGSSIVAAIATMVDATLHSHLAEDVLAEIQKDVIKVLAIELAVEALPDNPTGDELLKFEQDVIKAITGKDAYGKSKFYTTFAAQVYDIVHSRVDAGTKFTFAEIVKIIEEAYQDFIKDKE